MAQTIEVTHESHVREGQREQVQVLIAEYLGQDPIELPPVADVKDVTKQEMIDHLVNVHGVRQIDNIQVSTWADGTKVTKARMAQYHDNLHQVLGVEDLVVHQAWDPHQQGLSLIVRRKEDDRYGATAVLPTIRHTHLPLDSLLSAATSTALSAAREGKKTEGVLSVNERKVLTEVVNNDFGALKQDMRAFASDTLAAKKQEINAEWDTREAAIPNFAEEATGLRREHDKAMRALRQEFETAKSALEQSYQDEHKAVVQKAGTAGVLLESETQTVYDDEGNRVNATVFKAKVEGREKALSAADRENALMLERALMDLEKQRLTAQRQVLLSGVPDNALTLLESIPDAKTLMVQSKQDSVAAIKAASNTDS